MEPGPRLNDRQRRVLLAAARDSLQWHLRGVTVAEPAVEESGLGAGAAFVTLKNCNRLRGCVGNLDPSQQLLETIHRCAVLAAFDSRFTPVGVDEIDELEIIISVLGPFSPIEHPREIVIGTHGLMIRWEKASGILLPEVAVEHGVGKLGFVESVCRKAGLPPSAWQQGAALYTFTTARFSSAAS